LMDQKKVVDQLRQELEVARIPVSASVKELMDYVLQHMKDEYLLRKNSEYMSTVEKQEKDNPWPLESICYIF